jgi:hypothetical protein
MRKFSKREKEVLDFIKTELPTEDKAGWVFGCDFNMAIRLAREGFVGYKFHNGNGTFWFITDDPTQSKKVDVFDYFLLTLHKDLIHPNTKSLNCVYVKVHVNQKWGSIRDNLKPLGIAAKDILYSMVDAVSEEDYNKTTYLKVDCTLTVTNP